MMNPASIRRSKSSEEGYVLLAVIFLLALLTISLAVALPKVSKEIQRDREVETMQRGKQYARAVKLYYEKFGGYPPNLDALIKPSGPGNIRFLRKKYIDPITGKDDWKPILFGQNKAPTAMGFFGVPLGGSTIAGVGPGGGNGVAGASPAGGSSPFGSGSSGSSSFGSSSFGSSSSGATSNSGASTDSSTGATGSPADSSGSSSGSSSSGSTGGVGGSSIGGSGTGSSGIGGSGTGPSGQTFGGAGIIGFSPASPKQSILVYKKKNHYNEWEFVYDPIADQMMQQGAMGGAPGTGVPGTSGAQGSSSPFGSSSFGSSSSSSGSSFGSSFGGASGGTSPGGNAPTPPSTPQP